MTKTFPEVISGIRTAKKGVEVREDIAQMGEYVEQFASTATTKASEAEESAERAKNAVDGIDQQKADAVKAVQQAQATATNAVTETKNAALHEVSDATADANSAANAAVQAATAAAGSASTASGAATAATTKAGESAASADASASSASAAATSEANAKKYADEAGAKANTDKTLGIENAPADAKAVGDIILDRTKDTPEAIFYSKAEVEAKIKEAIAAALSERDERDHGVGSFYASNNPTSPAQKYGGTWERIEGKFIMGASDTYPAGSTGGMSSHYHTASLRYILSAEQVVGGSKAYSVTMIDSADAGLETSAKKDPSYNEQLYYATGDYTTSAASQYTSTGTTSVESCIPPYYSMYIWWRVA